MIFAYLRVDMENVKCSGITRNGKDKITFNDFDFRIEKCANGRLYWICIDKEKFKCSARMITSLKLDGNFSVFDKTKAIHNHDVYVKSNLSNTIKDLVSNNKFIKTSTLLNKIHGEDRLVEDLPLDINLKARINYFKRKLYPKEPLTVDDLNVESMSFKTNDDENFVLALSEDKSFLILGTLRNLERLFTSQRWICDGTFKVVPRLFQQLFTFFGCFYDRYFPLIFVLMQAKSQNAYEDVLNLLMKLRIDNELDIADNIEIMLDFEKASANAFQNVIPNVTIRRCLFHLSQNVYRKIQECGLTTLYKSEEVSRCRLKMLPALSFLPTKDVKVGFNSIREGSSLQLLPVIDYFDYNYVHGKFKYATRSGIKIFDNPSYPIDEWNASISIGSNKPRTSNYIEGWHNKLRVLCNGTHINLWELLELLLGEHHAVWINMQQHLINGAQLVKSKKQCNKDLNIAKLFAKYNAGVLPIDDYLFGVQGNLKMDFP